MDKFLYTVQPLFNAGYIGSVGKTDIALVPEGLAGYDGAELVLHGGHIGQHIVDGVICSENFLAAGGHRVAHKQLERLIALAVGIRQNMQPDDLVVSASPEFLLAPACRRLGIRPPIASRVDARTGRYTGLNCKGAEKVSRFREQYPDAEIGQFYSDSRSDAPLAHLARRAFLVRGDSYTSWEV